jgi:hypothetical protein
MQGSAFAFCVVVLLPADKNPHMIPSELQDKFIECALLAHRVHKAKNPYMDRQIFQYVNNRADANNVKTITEILAHTVRIFKFDFDSSFSMQRDMANTVSKLYLEVDLAIQYWVWVCLMYVAIRPIVQLFHPLIRHPVQMSAEKWKQNRG